MRQRLRCPPVMKSRLVCIISDIHFDLHDGPTWRAFCKWHAMYKPWKTVILGDFVDLGMMSRYIQESDAQLHAIPQIQCFVKEANKLMANTDHLEVMEGNHDERWNKMVFGDAPHVLRDATGLTLREQCYAQGLDKAVHWIKESVETPYIKVGQFQLRHGHRQSGRFGGGKHLSANRLMKSLGRSEVFGHHHRLQMFCQTSDKVTAIAIANPCMTGDHEYASNADWQRGFTILELNAPKYVVATPYPVLIHKGRFSWGGHTFDGNLR